MRESDIMHESGMYWVAREPKAYTVCKNGATHSTRIQSFARTPDGLSIAIEYCKYLGGNKPPASLKQSKN